MAHPFLNFNKSLIDNDMFVSNIARGLRRVGTLRILRFCRIILDIKFGKKRLSTVNRRLEKKRQY